MVITLLSLPSIINKKLEDNNNMKEIIKVNYNNEQPTVSARELHEGLEIKSNFTTWFDRMKEYGFTESDYKKCFPNLESGCNGGQNMVDYQISVDMAKQICMIQRSDKGRQYRQYFLDLEKAWNTPEQVMARALRLADKTIENLKLVIEEQRPLVDFANKVSDSSNLIDMGKMAKLLKDEHINIGRNRLFEWLRQKEILMKNNIPYQRYIEGGYFQVKESVYETPYGIKTNVTTFVTGKGQIYITEKLRKEWK